jgi:hypothetical protein
MTREEAKNITSWMEFGINQDKWTDPYDLIDKIYNDFESRTCESCKHSRTTDGYSNVWCESDGILDDVNTSREFCCVDWESKDE